MRAFFKHALVLLLSVCLAICAVSAGKQKPIPRRVTRTETRLQGAVSQKHAGLPAVVLDGKKLPHHQANFNRMLHQVQDKTIKKKDLGIREVIKSPNSGRPIGLVIRTPTKPTTRSYNFASPGGRNAKRLQRGLHGQRSRKLGVTRTQLVQKHNKKTVVVDEAVPVVFGGNKVNGFGLVPARESSKQGGQIQAAQKRINFTPGQDIILGYSKGPRGAKRKFDALQDKAENAAKKSKNMQRRALAEMAEGVAELVKREEGVQRILGETLRRRR
ncbi:hypothetical protein HDU67_008702 [Dinochytrium kinnereticum]|nr:hypothetical protein HDU67_008702 [Dinochytrium kinnereticum]